MNALDRLVEIALSKPCKEGEPRLHALIDGELDPAAARAAKAHVRACSACRLHYHWLELEEQTVREIAAPSAARFVALWSDRLERKMAAAVASEAGAALLRSVLARRRGIANDREAVARYLPQLAQWLGRSVPKPAEDGTAADATCLAEFEALLGTEWAPAVAARRLLASST